MERICIDTLHSLFYGYPSMRVPPESRMVVKRFPSRHFASPCGRGGRAQRGRRGQITATSNRKMLAPSQADDVPRAQGPLSHQVTALPKESQGIVYWHKKWSVSVSIRSIHWATLNARAARKSDGRKTVSVLAPSPCGRWPSAARTERANNGNVQSENAGTFAGR